MENTGTLREAQNDGLAVAALFCAFLCFPLGIYFGHASNAAAKRQDRRKSPLASVALFIGYGALDILATFALLATYPVPAAALLPTAAIFAVRYLIVRQGRKAS